MTLLVPLQEIENLFKKMKMGDNSEIQDYVKGWNEGLRITSSFLGTLPTIDIDKIIDGMIELYESSYSELSPEEERTAIKTLEELKERLSLLNK